MVLGSAIKATGSQMPLYVPNGVVLEECIQRAYERSGLNPSDADYVELHATGILPLSFIPRMSLTRIQERLSEILSRLTWLDGSLRKTSLKTVLLFSEL